MKLISSMEVTSCELNSSPAWHLPQQFLSDRKHNQLMKEKTNLTFLGHRVFGPFFGVPFHSAVFPVKFDPEGPQEIALKARASLIESVN